MATVPFRVKSKLLASRPSLLWLICLPFAHLLTPSPSSHCVLATPPLTGVVIGLCCFTDMALFAVSALFYCPKALDIIFELMPGSAQVPPPLKEPFPSNPPP